MISTYLSQHLPYSINSNYDQKRILKYALFSGLSFISLSIFSSASGTRGIALTALIYTVSRITTPLFVEIFKKFENISLAPLIGQLINLSFCILSTKLVLNVFGFNCSISDLQQVLFCNIIALQITNMFFKFFPPSITSHV